MTTFIFSKLNASRRHPDLFEKITGEIKIPVVHSINTYKNLLDKGMVLSQKCNSCGAHGIIGDIPLDIEIKQVRSRCPRCNSENGSISPSSKKDLQYLENAPKFIYFEGPLEVKKKVKPRKDENEVDNIIDILPEIEVEALGEELDIKMIESMQGVFENDGEEDEVPAGINKDDKNRLKKVNIQQTTKQGNKTMPKKDEPKKVEKVAQGPKAAPKSEPKKAAPKAAPKSEPVAAPVKAAPKAAPKSEPKKATPKAAPKSEPVAEPKKAPAPKKAAPAPKVEKAEPKKVVKKK